MVKFQKVEQKNTARRQGIVFKESTM